MFGCRACIPEEPRHATELGLVEIARLVDESHFLLKIRACPACEQRFVWTYTELVDYEAGDDHPCWTVLPVTREEAAEMIAAGEGVDLHAIQVLGLDRRLLRDDGATFAYGYGAVIGEHS